MRNDKAEQKLSVCIVACLVLVTCQPIDMSFPDRSTAHAHARHASDIRSDTVSGTGRLTTSLRRSIWTECDVQYNSSAQQFYLPLRGEKNSRKIFSWKKSRKLLLSE